jgi:hypothetical protein
MPAGPVGSVWASGTWTDTCWEENTWADVGVGGGEAVTGSRMRYGYRLAWASLLFLMVWGS